MWIATCETQTEVIYSNVLRVLPIVKCELLSVSIRFRLVQIQSVIVGPLASMFVRVNESLDRLSITIIQTLFARSS